MKYSNHRNIASVIDLTADANLLGDNMLSIGHIVTPILRTTLEIDSHYCRKAVVVCTEPLVVAALDGSMIWSDDLKPTDFLILGTACDYSFLGALSNLISHVDH